MIFSVEAIKCRDNGDAAPEIEITLDQEGIEFLVSSLLKLRDASGTRHNHFMTASWGGWELSEKPFHSGGALVQHVCVTVFPEADKFNDSEKTL